MSGDTHLGVRFSSSFTISLKFVKTEPLKNKKAPIND
jgi:hypothetical protein